jgi:energy-coupling factor transporter ATP-binding protein EcfA2
MNTRDEICDQINFDLPQMFNKEKYIFEPIYNKHGFHNCILTLEYCRQNSIIEYTDDIVNKSKLIEYRKKAYIKIKNKGRCICGKISIFPYFNNGNQLTTIPLISEKEYQNNIEKIKIELDSERKIRKELEYKLKNVKDNVPMKNEKREINMKNKEYNELFEKDLNYKIGKLEKDINIIKNEIINRSNPNIMKKEDDDSNDSLIFLMNDIYEMKKEFLINQSKDFKSSIELYEKEVINPTIKTLIENFYTEFLNNLRYKDFQNTIFNFLDFETMYFSIKKKLEENINTICKNITKTKHFNIVLLGREGVGKSTLVNMILKLDKENQAKTGEGDSVTLEIKKYSNPKIDFLRLYDTQGIGIKEDNKIETIFSNISKLINEQIIKEDSNPDDLIHCLWFCFNGRFGDLEIEILQKLSETYSDKKLPFIIVHTKTFSKHEAKKSIKIIIDKYKISKDNICQVLARDEDEKEIDDDSSEEEESESKKKAFGIGELMKKTVDKIEAAVESANYQFTKYHIFIEVDKYLESISKGKELIFKEELYHELSFDKLKEKLSETLYNKAKSLIESITNKELDKKTELLSRIQLFLFDTISQSESIFNSMVDEISKNHSPEIGRILFEKKEIEKNEINDSQNEKYFMIEYQNDIKKKHTLLEKQLKKKY